MIGPHVPAARFSGASLPLLMSAMRSHIAASDARESARLSRNRAARIRYANRKNG